METLFTILLVTEGIMGGESYDNIHPHHSFTNRLEYVLPFQGAYYLPRSFPQGVALGYIMCCPSGAPMNRRVIHNS